MYFNGCPVNIEAIPQEGNVFSYWSVNEYLLNPNTGESLSIDLAIDDVFTANFNAPLSLEEHTDIAAMIIYPNPSEGLVKVRLPGLIAQSIEVRISDSLGRIAYKESFAKDSTSDDLALDLSHLHKGVYMIALHTKNQVLSERLIIR